MTGPATPRLVLVAGPSGSGKSWLARQCGCAVLRLDDFYRDSEHPGLPQTLGIVDWDHPDSWDADAALAAIRTLLSTGQAEVPDYSIAESRVVGRRLLRLGASWVVVAEGVFAVELLAPCRAAGLPAEPIYLDRPGVLVFWLRLRRDLKQKRKPPLILLRRGLALWRAQRGLKRRAVAAGFTPLSMKQAAAFLSSGEGVSDSSMTAKSTQLVDRPLTPPPPRPSHSGDRH